MSGPAPVVALVPPAPPVPPLLALLLAVLVLLAVAVLVVVLDSPPVPVAPVVPEVLSLPQAIEVRGAKATRNNGKNRSERKVLLLGQKDDDDRVGQRGRRCKRRQRPSPDGGASVPRRNVDRRRDRIRASADCDHGQV